tara:strand:+ start:260 stop:526 length:267 start_codon:yes stop_codon:yes gene_type:complete
VALFDHATGDPSTATAERFGLVGIVVTTFVNHQCVAFEIAKAFQAGRQDWLVGLAFGVNYQDRQITHMAFAPRFAVFASILPVSYTHL